VPDSSCYIKTVSALSEKQFVQTKRKKEKCEIGSWSYLGRSL